MAHVGRRTQETSHVVLLVMQHIKFKYKNIILGETKENEDKKKRLSFRAIMRLKYCWFP